VALGKCQEKQSLGEDEFTDLRDSDFNSRKVCGKRRPNPEYDVTLPYGEMIIFWFEVFMIF